MYTNMWNIMASDYFWCCCNACFYDYLIHIILKNHKFQTFLKILRARAANKYRRSFWVLIRASVGVYKLLPLYEHIEGGPEFTIF